MHACALPLTVLDIYGHPLFVQEAAAAAAGRPYLSRPRITNPSFKSSYIAVSASSKPIVSKFRSVLNSSSIGSTFSGGGGDDEGDDYSEEEEEEEDDYYEEEEEEEEESQSFSRDGIDIEIEKVGKNSRRIHARAAIEADLHTIWNILTDYERLADFIPGLAVSRLIEKRESFARLFQIGQQNLAFGLKFSAKGIVDCYEKDLESFPHGQKRDIEFKMIEGDFQIFEGRWSIEECKRGGCQGGDLLMGQEFYTILSYIVDVEPKLWLPVRFVEGRLCREIRLNLSCIREEAKNAIHNTLPAH